MKNVKMIFCSVHMSVGFAYMVSSRLLLFLIATIVSMTFLVPVDSHAQDVTAAQVRKSIDRASKFLLSKQTDDGTWQGINDARYLGSTTSLATLALLNAGESPRRKEIRRAIDQLIQIPNERLSTYVASLRLMVLTAADPKGQTFKPEIQNDVDWLIEGQVTKGKAIGGWSYPLASDVFADSSNSQYALLALHEASKVGARIPRPVWENARDYWEKCFHPSGGFGYSVSKDRVNGSMTCAGISSLIIAQENLAEFDGLIENGRVACCQPNSHSEMVDRALEWMAKRFAVRGNPGQSGNNRAGKFYYLYGMERAARLSGRRFLGKFDWYREGVNELVNTQKTNGSWIGTQHFDESTDLIATSFALLFLAKGKRPIVIGKYKFGVGDDWDRHPQGVHYLTRELEKQWKTKLNWQTIDGSRATVQDLAETPVLFISGKSQLDLTTAQKQALKDYIENGNFIFAEASQGNGCGKDVAFDRKFRALMSELFPETKLEALSASHPVWNSHFEMVPDANWPILGLQACCRTSVVYVPRSLTGHWQLNRQVIIENIPDTARKDVNYATHLGVNVVSYATGRQLRDKLDLPHINSQSVSVLENRSLVLPKLQHRGGADDAPNAWRNVLTRADEIGLMVDLEKKLISPIPEQLFDHPFLFMHGRNNFYFKNDEIDALKQYLKGGNRGFILADSICSSRAFNQAFEKQIVRIVPGEKLSPIDPAHPIWTNRYGGFNIETVTITKPDRSKSDGFTRRTVAPQFKGIEIDGRLVVVYSPLDMSCALENATLSHCEGYTRQDALKLALNVLLYRLQSD